MSIQWSRNVNDSCKKLGTSGGLPLDEDSSDTIDVKDLIYRTKKTIIDGKLFVKCHRKDSTLKLWKASSLLYDSFANT